MEINNRHADAKVDRAGIAGALPEAHRSGIAQRGGRVPTALPRRVIRHTRKISGRLPGQVGRGDEDSPAHRRGRQRLPSQSGSGCEDGRPRDGESGNEVDADDQMRSISAALRPGIRAMTKGHNPGDVLARLDIDPYHRSFRNMSTHILAHELNETAIRRRFALGMPT